MPSASSDLATGLEEEGKKRKSSYERAKKICVSGIELQFDHEVSAFVVDKHL